MICESYGSMQALTTCVACCCSGAIRRGGEQCFPQAAFAFEEREETARLGQMHSPKPEAPTEARNNALPTTLGAKY